MLVLAWRSPLLLLIRYLVNLTCAGYIPVLTAVYFVQENSREPMAGNTTRLMAGAGTAWQIWNRADPSLITLCGLR